MYACCLFVCFLFDSFFIPFTVLLWIHYSLYVRCIIFTHNRRKYDFDVQTSASGLTKGKRSEEGAEDEKANEEVELVEEFEKVGKCCSSPLKC